jgi:hypothetical protein
MKNLLLALIALAAIASAACNHERKADPPPNDRGARDASERSHQSLDKEAGGSNE